MAEPTGLSLKIKYITECLICTDAYIDPKVPPCFHTCGVKCLDRWDKDNQLGDQVSCPPCRKESVVPTGGFEALPRNFFVAKLLEVKEIASFKIMSKYITNETEISLM